MIAASLALVALAALGGFGIAWGIRDARQRHTDNTQRYPDFISWELQDIEQRRAWRRLTEDERQWVTDALFLDVARTSRSRT